MSAYGDLVGNADLGQPYARSAAPAGVPGTRLRYGIIIGAAIVALALVAGIAVTQVAAWRANHLPGSFIGATLLPPSQHYARDMADGDQLAKSYPGKPDDYRKWLETNWNSGEREGESWPVQPTKALTGRYDRAGTPMRIGLTRYSIDPKIWDSYVQQRQLNVVIGESKVAVGSDVYCYPDIQEGDDYGTSCVKVVRDGFWLGYAYVIGQGGGVPVRNVEVARDMAGLG